jgi:predicted  nucleic acid-binding Zn-ribbon protein
MGPTLSALVRLQSVEVDLTKLRRRMHMRRNAVRAQEARIAKHTAERDALHAAMMGQRVRADALELQLKEAEAKNEKYRNDLNGAKTNKEYAAILTQINTVKADNARVEEEELKLLGQIDIAKESIAAIDTAIAEEQGRLEEIQTHSADEIAKLETMIAQLSGKRDEAAEGISETSMTLFDRLASQYEGEALAEIQASGRRAPYSYSCGGCYMSLNAEHANALRSRDEIRQCDNCQRILYITNEEA